MALMSIGEAARRTGLRPSALRYYEEIGLLPPAPRVGGKRRYDARALRMIEVLRFAQQAGFTLAEIGTLFHGFDAGTPPGERWRALASAKLAELDELVATASRMRRAIEEGLRCGCLRLEDCTLGAAPEREAMP